jgi:type IV pilus assembly protein PilN
VLVEINLLPQKQPRSSTSLKLIILMALAFILISLLIFWQVQKNTNEINQLEANIASYEQSITSLQQDVSAESTNSYVELSNAVDWSLSYPIKSVAILKHLNSLLPERGFLLSYSYTETGTISLNVQFDTKKEAAYYLKWLNDSEWVEDVKLSQLSSSQIETTEDTAEEGTTAEDMDTETESYLPRYTGSFEITLNREKIKLTEQVEGTESKEEGGNEQ